MLSTVHQTCLSFKGSCRGLNVAAVYYYTVRTFEKKIEEIIFWSVLNVLLLVELMSQKEIITVKLNY